MLVLGFPDYDRQARALASALGSHYAPVDLHHFPDGESRLRLPARLPAHVVLCRSLDQPNEKLTELLLAVGAARSLGACHLTLVAPYLCYMRQDKAFRPGEAVSQQIVGAFLAGLVDTLVTVDPHLHRTPALGQAVPVQRAEALSAAPAMGAFLAARASRPILVGPDQESEQWVRIAAEAASLDYVVAHKTRLGDDSVDVRLPRHDFAAADVVLVDDVASTGQTLAATARSVLEAGARRVDALITHALFVDDALERLRRAGVTDVWSSDSVTHSSNAFALATALAAAVRCCSAGVSGG